MVINGEVVNNTYCNFTRNCGTGIGPEESTQHEIIDDQQLSKLYKKEWDNSTGILEPLVGNGVAMIVVEPLNQSVSFEPELIIRATKSTEVRLGPGTNYASIGSVSEGMTGEVKEHMNQLNGVYAKNSHWWKVDFGNLTGWVKEDAINAWMIPGGIKSYLPQILR